MYFIYGFYLKSPPPVSHPPCTFFNQVLHMWYTVNCLDLRPPHLCTKFKKNVHSSQYPVTLPQSSPLQRRSYLCSFSCRCRESMLYVLNAQKEHTRAFFVWTARICESIPILERVGVMSQFPHLYIFVRPPTLMWIGFSMNPAEVIAVASSSVSSSLVSNLVGVEVGVGVVAVLTYLSSWGSSPAPTSLHVFSKAAHPSATNW